jgi:hypothetical protein
MSSYMKLKQQGHSEEEIRAIIRKESEERSKRVIAMLKKGLVPMNGGWEFKRIAKGEEE